jgi:hypothetical protein
MPPVRKIVVILLILLAGGIVWFGWNLYFGIDDAYAQWGAADMVIHYMRDNDGKWPPDWEALRGYFDKGGGRVGGWSFAQYKSRVFIDFGADPRELRKQSLACDRVPFRVIAARWTVGVVWGDGPNAMLYDYFRREAAKAGLRAEPARQLRPLGSQFRVDQNGVIWDGEREVGVWGADTGGPSTPQTPPAR